MKYLVVAILLSSPFMVEAQTDTVPPAPQPQYLTEVVPVGKTFYDKITGMIDEMNRLNAELGELITALREQGQVDSTFQFVRMVPERQSMLFAKQNPEYKAARAE